MNNLNFENAIDGKAVVDGNAIMDRDVALSGGSSAKAPMINKVTANPGASTALQCDRAEADAASYGRKRRAESKVSEKAAPASARHPGRKSKKNQLIALLSKPNGVRISVIVEKLGWQAHTVRATLSGLRKNGFEITTSKSAKTDETVYAIVPGKKAAGSSVDGAAA